MVYTQWLLRDDFKLPDDSGGMPKPIRGWQFDSWLCNRPSTCWKTSQVVKHLMCFKKERKKKHMHTMNGESQLVITDELVEFEK